MRHFSLALSNQVSRGQRRADLLQHIGGLFPAARVIYHVVVNFYSPLSSFNNIGHEEFFPESFKPKEGGWIAPHFHQKLDFVRWNAIVRVRCENMHSLAFVRHHRIQQRNLKGNVNDLTWVELSKNSSTSVLLLRESWSNLALELNLDCCDMARQSTA